MFFLFFVCMYMCFGNVTGVLSVHLRVCVYVCVCVCECVCVCVCLGVPCRIWLQPQHHRRRWRWQWWGRGRLCSSGRIRGCASLPSPVPLASSHLRAFPSSFSLSSVFHFVFCFFFPVGRSHLSRGFQARGKTFLSPSICWLLLVPPSSSFMSL